MSIADLGSLGEFFGSIAVVVTLIFLTLQMRQNTKAVQTSTSAVMVTHWIDNANAFATDPDLSMIWNRAIQEGTENIDRAEMLRLIYWLIGNLKSVEFAYLQWRSGNLPEELWATNKRGLNNLVAGNPLLNTTLWNFALKPTFTDDFQQVVESMIAARADSS